METALHEFLHHTESTFEYKLYTLAMCTDTEGAFNNDSVVSLIQSLFMENHFLRNWISCGLYDVIIRNKAIKGTPQEGILSQFFQEPSQGCELA